MLYEFFKKEHPELECVLEKGENALEPDEITSVHILD
jgi:glucokinase